MEPGLVEMHHHFLSWWFEDLTPRYDWHNFAVSIHMRCWVLAQQVIGSKIHDNLELFLAVSLLKVSAWDYVYGDSPPWEEHENRQGTIAPLIAFRAVLARGYILNFKGLRPLKNIGIREIGPAEQESETSASNY